MKAISRARVDRGPVRLVSETVRISVWAVLGAWLARKSGRLIVGLFRSPIALVTLGLTVAVVWVWRAFGLLPILVTAAVLAAALIGWRVRWPGSFHHRVRCTVRGWRRGGWVYRRRWATAMDTAGLALTRDGTLYLPALVRVRCSLSVDRVRVRMLPGQTLDDFAGVADRLAQTFGTLDCRIRSVPRRVHELDLWLLICDPLAEVVPPFDPPPFNPPLEPFTFRLPVALAEDGTVWWLDLLGTHVLVVGVTGAGKGSVIWSILTALDEAITARVVQVWVIDPKGGMELALGASPVPPVLLRRQQPRPSLLRDHLRRAPGGRRSGDARPAGPAPRHHPTPRTLNIRAADCAHRRRDRRAHGVDHRPGSETPHRRGVGAAAVPRPGGRCCRRRGGPGPPQRSADRPRPVPHPDSAQAQRGGAGEPGPRAGRPQPGRTLCDRIPDTLPGVGYVTVDGIAEPVRVRFSHITDSHIATLGRDGFPEPAQLVAVPDIQEVAA